MYSGGGSSSGDKEQVPEPAGYLVEEPLLIDNFNSPIFDIDLIFERSTSGNTSHVPVPFPMPICHPSMMEAVVAKDKVKDDRNKLVGNAGGVSSPATQSADPVMFNEGEGSSVKRGRGRPTKSRLIDSVVPVSSQSQSGHLPVVNEGSLVTRSREMPPRSCKKTKSAETDVPSHEILGSGKEHEAGATIPCTHSRDISGSAGSGFLLHTITVRTKEDVMRKVLSFLHLNRKQVACIMSANGTISDVTIQQSWSPGGTITYQGCFDILSLSGSFMLSKSGGQNSITGGLSVLLGESDGHVFGGSVSGMFTALSSVQIILGKFLAAICASNIWLQ